MVLMPFDFGGASVFVAGGTSGINLGIAEAYAKAGANIAVISRNAERVAGAVERLSAHGGKVAGRAADVRDIDAVRAAMAEAVDAHGPLDVLVSGAAGNFMCPANELSSNGFRVVVEIDLVGTFHVMRCGYDFARKPGASFINISAPQSIAPAAMQMHACAAKAGLDQVMRVAALEWGAEGIRVNSIMPGPIEGTAGLDKLVSAAERQRCESRIPLRRVGQFDDINQLALFLGSGLSSYITGALIPCDGGAALLGGRNYAGAPEQTGRAG